MVGSATDDRSLAVRIRREIADAEGTQGMQWAFVELIEKALDASASAVQSAVRYGAKQGWFLLEGEPVHSVILCETAALILPAAVK